VQSEGGVKLCYEAPVTRWLAVSLSFTAFAASACFELPSASAPSEITPGRAAPEKLAPGVACVSASLLVDKETATAAAVDPVETQLAILKSRSFASAAPAGVDLLGSMRVERMGHSAVLALRVYGEPTRARATCQWVASRMLAENNAERAANQGWLHDQELKLQVDVDAAEQELQTFDKSHELLSLPLDQILELQQAELKEMIARQRRGDRTLQDSIRTRSAQVMELRSVQIDREHLVRRVDNGRRLVAMLHEKSAEKDVESMIAPPVRVLDACAPCDAPLTTAK
jgi:hypothetical protein